MQRTRPALAATLDFANHPRPLRSQTDGADRRPIRACRDVRGLNGPSAYSASPRP